MLALACLLPVAGEDALPDPVVQMILPEDVLFGDGMRESLAETVDPPEMAPPYAPAKAGAFILRWDRYRTLVVIDNSAGLLKSCWVVTLSTMPERIDVPRGAVMLARGQVVVAYRAQAYLDKEGVLHIDARRARLSGVMAGNWSPDSFSITPDRQVSSRDDDPSHPGNAGEIEKEVPVDAQREEYGRLLFTAQAIIEGNI
jgi:hypothetical protein